MIDRLIHHLISRQERALGVSLDYPRELRRSSPWAFVKFMPARLAAPQDRRSP